jgi:hypothetical protein
MVMMVAIVSFVCVCMYSGSCPSGYCVGNNGDSCISASDCASGYCDTAYTSTCRIPVGNSGIDSARSLPSLLKNTHNSQPCL